MIKGQLRSLAEKLMVILVSDLHLNSETTVAGIDLRFFLEQIDLRIKRAAELGIETIHLILLGDIFEILKSSHWLVGAVRPWEAVTEKHVKVVTSIFESIVNSNQDFFDGLRELTTKSFLEVHLEYIPGNHDRPLNIEMGAKARKQLQDILPLTRQNGQEFDSQFINSQHGLIAKHGHEWDRLNRSGPGGAAIGDAVVIDILLALPFLMSTALGLTAYDPDLLFLHELDNIRPLHPALMARWIQQGLADMAKKHKRVHTLFRECCEELVRRFQLIRSTTEFEIFEAATWWIKMLADSALVTIGRVGALNTARFVPSLGESPDQYRDFAISDIQQASNTGISCRYVVCGHTHNPVIVPLNTGGKNVTRGGLYLNTGAWRKVYKVAHGSGQQARFSSWNEACVISIYDQKEQQALGTPSYEFHRLTSGVDV